MGHHLPQVKGVTGSPQLTIIQERTLVKFTHMPKTHIHLQDSDLPARDLSQTIQAADVPPRLRRYANQDPQSRLSERRSRLLDAALSLFAEQGYAATSIERLCSQAKVTTRHFYEVFSSKEQLMLALYDALMQDLQQALLTAMQQPLTSMEQRIALLCNALVQHYLQDRRRAQVGVIEVVGATAAIEQRRRQVINNVVQLISGFAQQSGQPLPDEQRLHWLVVAGVGALNEMMAEWLMRPSLTLDELRTHMIQIAQTLWQGSQLLQLQQTTDNMSEEVESIVT